MLYFILWVVFALVVILAVPITAMMGKPKRPKPVAAEPNEMSDESFEEAAAEEAFVAEEGFNEAEFQSEPAAADDFSAFDEEFK